MILKRRAGFSILEGLVSAAILSIAVGFLLSMLRQSNTAQRSSTTKKSAGKIDASVPKSVLLLVGNYLRGAAGNCTGGGFTNAVNQDLGNGIRLRLITAATPAPAGLQGAATRCARPTAILGGMNTRRNLYFCLLITNSPGFIAPRDSILSMQPVIGEFMFEASNVATANPVSCQALPQAANTNDTGALLTYSLHWGEEFNTHKKSNVSYEPRI